MARARRPEGSRAGVRPGADPNDQPHVALVRALKAQRISSGITLAQISERSGIDPPALSRLERGLTRNPTIGTLARYAAALGKRLQLGVADESDRAMRPAPVASEAVVVRLEQVPSGVATGGRKLASEILDGQERRAEG